MCKLFSVTGKLNRKTVRRLLFAVNGVYSKTQRHGFGFVAIGAESFAHGRYVDPDRYLGFGSTQHIPEFLRGVADENGALPNETTILIAHGRTSTNQVCAENVHPFRNDALFLAHNGVLNWIGKRSEEPPAAKGCDSEQLLNWIVAGGKWEDCVNCWDGFGAVMLASSANGVLVIAQDTAQLYGAKRLIGPGWMFATNGDDLQKIAGKAGIRLATRPIWIPKRLIYFDNTGALVGDQEWAGFGYRQFAGNGVHVCEGFNVTVKHGHTVKTYKHGKEIPNVEDETGMLPHWERGINGGQGYEG